MMIRASELKSFTREAAAIVARDKAVAAFEIYCASGDNRIARLNYTSDIPCRGVEELKSHRADGFQIRIVEKRNPQEVGTAYEAADFGADSIRSVLARAHRATVIDPHFPGFPTEPRKMARVKTESGDLRRASDGNLVDAAWSVLRGALNAFARGDAARSSHPGLVLGGDVSLIRDRIAIANSNFADIRADEGAHFSSSVTALIESIEAKGTASAVGRSIAEMRRVAARLGRDATARALQMKHGTRPDAQTYRVVLGPQPIAEIINYMILGSLTTGAFHAASSAYQGKFGAEVMDKRMTLSDDPILRRGAVLRAMTCEGLPVKRVDLIRDGKLVGLFSNFYDSHRLATDAERSEKLGVPNESVPIFPALSGYRMGEGGGRRFDQSPASAGTNIVMTARDGIEDDALIRKVRDGLYVGRVWYTYPINGQRAGDFTCTVSGDSHVIRNGKLAGPIAPNSLRINANIENVFKAIIAAGKRSHPAIVWGSSEAFYVPAIACEAISVSSVGDGAE
ncbi:MAG TPA: metallopeptidase TldD-related protein [Candidatus Binataceae bacterium]|nr:metallopeptidase TldD-related protein [Candidatus Binataceae bacterium]